MSHFRGLKSGLNSDGLRRVAQKMNERVPRRAVNDGDIALALPGGLDNIEMMANQLKSVEDPEVLIQQLESIQSIARSLVTMIEEQGALDTFKEPLVTPVGDGVEVSTALISTRQAPGGRTHRIYETMIFGGPRHGEAVRSGSAEEAQDYHDMMVADLQGELQ